MPVRIYDISKKLGLENKEIIAKAKALGIAAAKVPSSMLDKITAEDLENHLLKDHPEIAAKLAPKSLNPPVAPVVSRAPVTQPAVVPVQVKNAPPSPHHVPKSENRFANPRMLQQIQTKLQGQAAGRQYSPRAFENDVNRLLDDLFPYSVLPGIRLFSTEPRGKIDYGFEIDDLIHIRFGGVDYIIEIEAKHQPVLVDKGRWNVKYDGVSSCAREQVDNHIRTMWEYLKPVARQIELKFLAVVVSSDFGTARKKADGYRNAEMHLCSVKELPSLLAERFNFNLDPSLPVPEVLRVSQSGFLDLLRLSLPVKELGHPELASAIRYVDRCRRTLDETLFQKFEPSRDLWAINGSAGMGKSVLLAYTAAVLSSGHELYRFAGEVGVKKAADTFTKIGFNADPKKGSIIIMAMSAKQLENIRGWFNLFMEQFQKADYSGDVRFRPPEFVLCRPGESFAGLAKKCSALLVDEAHDIPQFAARELVELHQNYGVYLVVACDRHQKLRLAGADAKIIEGLDFTNRSTRLRQIYRNPAPIYLASLAIMFRWFAESGPKVIPSNKQLDEQFGLETVSLADGLEVTMRSDAHPANSWCHTVASFPDCASAFAALVKERLDPKDVLWVRFSEEDPDFDYEQLIRHFTYHNCRSHDAHKISDKYIKGQDYPIVVIEGFPGFMDRYDASGGQDAAAAENHAWAFRRELYLCASRATAFLYFICNVPETSEVMRIRSEIQRLVTAIAIPEGLNYGGTKSWKFVIGKTDQLRSLDVFADAGASAEIIPASVNTNTNLNTPPSVQLANDPAQASQNKIEVVTPPVVALPSPVPPPSVSPALPETVKPVAVKPSEPSQPKSAPVIPAPVQPPATNNPVGSAGPPPLRVPAVALTSKPLGDLALVSEVARHLGRDVDSVIAQLRSSGFAHLTPLSKVRVSSILQQIDRHPHSAPPKDAVAVQKVPSGKPAPAPVFKSMAAAAAAIAASAVKLSPAPTLKVPRSITVQQLADVLGVKPHVIIADLMKLNELCHSNQPMSEPSLHSVCARRGFEVTIIEN